MAAQANPSVATANVYSALPTDDYSQEYEKILRISDEIFTGTHPRLKVPEQFVRKVTPRNYQKPPLASSSQVTKNGEVEDSQAKISGMASAKSADLPAAASDREATTTMPPIPATAAATAATTTDPPSERVVPKFNSEIDPIFLTKSDDLVRAELQLQRQRVERGLRDQVDKKRMEFRKKVAFLEGKPDFDVSDVLNRALQIVRPVEPSDAVKANGAAVSSESLDEDSFYSSRAPDSPQPGEPQQPSPESDRRAPPSASDETVTDVPVDQRSDELRRLETLNQSASDLEMRDRLPVADQTSLYPRQTHCVQPDFPTEAYVASRSESLDKGEYSPPPPDVPPLAIRDNHEYHRGWTANNNKNNDNYNYNNNNSARWNPSSRGYYFRRSMSPPGDVRIIQNHITSPVAPQPSRVSPLAPGKVTPYQGRAERVLQREPTSDPGSPEPPPVVQLKPKKRRRVHDRQQAGEYSGAYIKEEPVSPPPFADDVRVPRSRPAGVERPIYIDVTSPRYTPVADRRELSVREPAYEYDPYHPRIAEQPVQIEPTPTIPREGSRISSRRPGRDDQDLRRVASLNQWKQPDVLHDYVERSPRAVRTPSYTMVERPVQERPRYYDEPAPVYTRRYIAAEETPISPRYRETYANEEPPVPIMGPPPQRRIVIDEHGNQYYETIPAPATAPAPVPTPRIQSTSRPASRVARSDMMDDRVPIRTTSALRGGSIVEDPYGERRYIQEMPPPPPQVSYRRVTEYGQPNFGERRVYGTNMEEREAAYPRSNSVQIADYPGRRATGYIDEQDIPRERVVRVPSVRPVQGREMSVFVDESGRNAREYPTREYIERPMYMATASRPYGYYDSGGEGFSQRY